MKENARRNIVRRIRRRINVRLVRAVLGQKIKDPHRALKRFERASADATFWIFLGILIESLGLVWFARDWLETGIALLGNALIGFGLMAEYVLILRAAVVSGTLDRESSRRVAEANARAAEANQKAKEAELELKRFRTPRREILKGKLERVTEQLKQFAGTTFDSGLSANSGEQADFWWDLEPALVSAGWVHLPWDFEPMTGGLLISQGSERPLSGSVGAADVEIHLHPEHRETLLSAATALISALNDAGVAAAAVGYNTHSVNKHAIHILIGDKQ